MTGGRHLLLYNAEFWSEADDRALTGSLAHELMHREWSDLHLHERLFDWTSDNLGYASIEHVMDYCVIGKGLYEELYRAKLYLLGRHEENYVKDDISPNAFHLADVFQRARGFRMPDRTDEIPKHPLPKDLAADVEGRLAAFSWHE